MGTKNSVLVGPQNHDKQQQIKQNFFDSDLEKSIELESFDKDEKKTEGKLRSSDF